MQKGETDNPKIIVEKFNTQIPIIDRTARQKINQEMENLTILLTNYI